MNRQFDILLAAVMAAGILNAAQAACQGGENLMIMPATPSAEFSDLGNGRVLHRPTQLIWARCALGQTWNGSACTGTPELMGWAAALNAADQAELAGLSNWRLPNRNELNAIVESRCHDPAINGEIFPDAPALDFWSSSPAQGDSVWRINFGQGELLVRPAAETAAVRLVSGGRR
ncbi:MAG: Lcl C-terminal domain-containing protein [Wenzhouxiangella sp.]